MTSTPVIVRTLLLAVLALGCFSPSYPDCGVACSTDGRCPAGYTCDRGMCRKPNDEHCQRPVAIGWLSRGCSAALVAPDAVVTAAHCVDFLNIVMPGDAVTFTDAAGVPRTFDVDQIRCFGASARTDGLVELIAPTNQPVPDGTGVNDVAVLHLAMRVPDELASPAAIADAPPDPGEAVTVYGHGCSLQVHPPGVVPLESFVTVFGGATDVCPYDSGGPVVVGDGTHGAAIWALNMGLHAPTRGVVASVTYFKTSIMKTLRSWGDGSPFDIGFDRPGPSIAEIVMSFPQPADCADACNANPDCRAFTTLGTRCFLKGGFVGWLADPTATSGVRPLVEEGILRAGTPYRFFDLPDERIDACWEACVGDAPCASWDVELGVTRRCRLMQDRPQAVKASGHVSGIKADLAPGVLQGRPLRDFEVSDVDACRRSCAADLRCRGFTVGSAPLHCWHMLTVRSREPSSDSSFVSAIRDGMAYINNGGTVLRDYGMGDVFVAEGCQADCAADPACYAWAFAGAGSYATEAWCWLKADLLTPPWDGYVSGVKGAEFTGHF